MVYSFYTNPTNTPPNQPVPGRENEMTENRAGGYAFKADLWHQLRLCLMLGTSNPAYYAGKEELTAEFVEVIKSAASENPVRLADEILWASDGRTINIHAPIFALSIMCNTTAEAKAEVKRVFTSVVRTGSHLHEFYSYLRPMGLGGKKRTGSLTKRLFKLWLAKDPAQLAYQMRKYPQRYGYSFRDHLRMIKPKPTSDVQSTLFGYVTKGIIPKEWPAELNQLKWYESVKDNPQAEHAIAAIKAGKLTHEMVAPIAEMSKAVWQTLFEQMPMTATVRNLGSLTEIGVLSYQDTNNLDLLERRLNKESLKKARVHPFELMKALKVYEAGGKIGSSSKVWTPIPRVQDILEKAIQVAFDSQEPTGKVFGLFLDVSGSMRCSAVQVEKSKGRGTPLTFMASELTAMLALTAAKTEPNYIVRGFNSSVTNLGITAADSYSKALNKVVSNTFGDTNAAAAFEWATKAKQYIDVFVLMTDGESWFGGQHAYQALNEYRNKVNLNAKAIYITLTPTSRTVLSDPSDVNSYNLLGFDTEAISYIQAVARGDI